MSMHAHNLTASIINQGINLQSSHSLNHNMWLDKYTNYTVNVNNKDQDVYNISLHGLLSRPCEDIFKLSKSLPIPNLQYCGMVKSDPVINAHHQITPINY